MFLKLLFLAFYDYYCSFGVFMASDGANQLLKSLRCRGVFKEEWFNLIVIGSSLAEHP
jgi:hypothetical protein